MIHERRLVVVEMMKVKDVNNLDVVFSMYYCGIGHLIGYQWLSPAYLSDT